MSIDIKAIIADSLLTLCEKKPLKKITVADIQEDSGISRQTFYNHFKDKLDLIQYIYKTRIVYNWNELDLSKQDYYDAKLSIFYNDIKYQNFIKQAVKITGTNCLVDFMYNDSQRFDRCWYQSFHGDKALTKEQFFASDYHSVAGVYMRIQWILDDFPISPEELLHDLIQVRLHSLNNIIFGNMSSESPYEQAIKRDRHKREGSLPTAKDPKQTI